MTTREEAIKNLKEHKSVYTNCAADAEANETIDIAIKSLDAWDEVLEELSSYGSIWVQYKITDKSEKGIEKLIEDVLRQAKEQVIDIIKKHLSEVEE